jgi:hypothetical protein
MFILRRVLLASAETLPAPANVKRPERLEAILRQRHQCANRDRNGCREPEEDADLQRRLGCWISP